jgi:hypothetical protein
MPTTHYESIQDYLIARGFTPVVNADPPYFHKDGMRISATELVGETVRTFIEKARRRNWTGAFEPAPRGAST